MLAVKFVVYEAKDGWRWRMVSSNGKIVAESGEAYTSKTKAKQGARRVVYSVRVRDVVFEEK